MTEEKCENAAADEGKVSIEEQTLEEVLGDLLFESAKLLLDRVKQGIASAAEIGVATKLCKDNSIELDMSNDDNQPLYNLALNLPVIATEEGRHADARTNA
jgi:hypothetical protein